MILRNITKQEVLSYFSNYGYEIEDDGNLLHIFCKQSKDHIYFKSAPKFSKAYLYVTLFIWRHSLGMPLKIEWHRFLMTTYLNRAIIKPQ